MVAAIIIIVLVVGVGIGVTMAVAQQRSVRIDRKTGQVIVKGRRVPIAGAHAEVQVDKSGMFGRTSHSVMVVTAADGTQLVAAIGGEYGNKGKSSRRDADRYRQLAAQINTLGSQRPARHA